MIELVGKFLFGVKGIGINVFIFEDFYFVEMLYWGMFYEDWESEFNLVVMCDEVYERFYCEEYCCFVCFLLFYEEKGILKCFKCGFIYVLENDFERVMEEFLVEEFVF